MARCGPTRSTERPAEPASGRPRSRRRQRPACRPGGPRGPPPPPAPPPRPSPRAAAARGPAPRRWKIEMERRLICRNVSWRPQRRRFLSSSKIRPRIRSLHMKASSVPLESRISDQTEDDPVHVSAWLNRYPFRGFRRFDRHGLVQQKCMVSSWSTSPADSWPCCTGEDLPRCAVCPADTLPAICRSAGLPTLIVRRLRQKTCFSLPFD